MRMCSELGELHTHTLIKDFDFVLGGQQRLCVCEDSMLIQHDQPRLCMTSEVSRFNVLQQGSQHVVVLELLGDRCVDPLLLHSVCQLSVAHTLGSNPGNSSCDQSKPCMSHHERNKHVSESRNNNLAC